MLDKIERLKVYVPDFPGYGSSVGYTSIINASQIDWAVKYPIMVNTVKEADLVVIKGGGDVHPSFYGQSVGRSTYAETDKKRDKLEFNAINEAVSRGVPVFGICRGLQILSVYAGGKLIQHTTGHSGSSHEIVVEANSSQSSVYNVNSLHHQMVYPYNLKEDEYYIIGWSNEPKSRMYLDGNDIEIVKPNGFCEPEIVSFNKINALGVQYHPEMFCGNYNLTHEYTLELLKSFLNNGSSKNKPFWYIPRS